MLQQKHIQAARLKQRPPVTEAQVWHTFFQPSRASSCDGGSRITVPLSSRGLAWVLSSSLLSIHWYHPVYALCGSFTPLLFTPLTQLLFWTPWKASGSLSSLSPLFFLLSGGACQSLLMSNSFAGALNSANFSFTLARSAPFSCFFFWFLLLL